jgi:hypothetical protein
MRVPQALYQKVTITALALGVLAIAPTKASATPIPLGGGAILNISNLVGTLVGVSNSCINWGYPAACSVNTAVSDSVSGSDPAVFTVGNTGTIKDLPIGVVLPLVDFQTVAGPLGLVHFDLTAIQTPATPVGNNCSTFALSAICTPGGGSPFTLFQASANQVGISMSMSELAYLNTSASGTTPYNAIFTTQLSGTLSNGQAVTIPNILSLIAGGGTITATWSATESPLSGVPEPSQFLLLGTGLVGLGLWKSRRHHIRS